MTIEISPDRMVRLQRADIARRYVESAEHWLRKLLHHQLLKEFGPTYLSKGPWKRELIKRVNDLKSQNPGQFLREIDATTFEQAIYLACHETHFKKLFEPALRIAYPNGPSEVKTFLERIKDIRNDISHGRGCSARQVERAICYGNDLADSIKAFFWSLNMQRVYNVPSIVRYSDNRGNEFWMDNQPVISAGIPFRHIDLTNKENGILYPGDNLIAEIEVDPTFDQNEYDVYWYLNRFEKKSGNVARIAISNLDVGEVWQIQFEIVSRENWHRYTHHDDLLRVMYRVLPPISTTTF